MDTITNRRLAAALAVLCLLLTACASTDRPLADGGSTTPTSTSTTPEPDQSTTAPALETTTTESTTVDTAPITAESDDDAGADPVELPTRDPLPDGRPGAFWAITSDTYELTLVDTATGDILGRFGGWGPGECDGEEECQEQVLDDLDVRSDGSLWLSDCCEPAEGSIFDHVPGTVFDPGSDNRFGGTYPRSSPSGRYLATSRLGAIEVWDTAGPLEAPVLTYGLTFDEQADDDLGAWLEPAGWINDDVMVVEGTTEVSALFLVDISDAANPTELTERVGGLLPYIDTAVRKDGAVIAAARLPGANLERAGVEGWVYNLETGERIAEFDLPDDTNRIDYDPTSTFLIVSGDEGTVRWFGAGKEGVLAEGFIAASW